MVGVRAEDIDPDCLSHERYRLHRFAPQRIRVSATWVRTRA